MHGKLCTLRVAGFYNGKNLAHFKKDQFHYVFMEGTYDFVPGCTNNHAGLRRDEIHGFFLKLTAQEFEEFRNSNDSFTKFGTVVSPGERNNSGMFIYTKEDITISRRRKRPIMHGELFKDN